jgi:hypothetical protein
LVWVLFIMRYGFHYCSNAGKGYERDQLFTD